MTSLSQATTSWELASPSWGLLGHVSHHARWPASLMPKGSWDACTSQGIATFLCAASRHSGPADEAHKPQQHRPPAEQPGPGEKPDTPRQDMAEGIVELCPHIARESHEPHHQPEPNN